MNPLKTTAVRLMTTALPVAVSLAFTSCSSTPSTPPAASATDTSMPSIDYDEPRKADTNVVINVEAAWADVTVESIDYTTRRVKLRRSDGALFDCKVGPLAVNFDKVQVGDQLRITMAEECVTFIGQGGAKPGTETSAAIVRVVVDGVPSAMAVTTTDLKARIMDVDIEARRIIAEIEKGQARSLKVAKGVNLMSLRPGDEIWLQVSEALAINIER